MAQISRQILIQNKKGLHARAAAKLVKLAAQYSSKISVTRLPRANETVEAATVTASSILGLLMLAGEKGVTLEIHADGQDAEVALLAIETLMNNKFDEGE